MGREYEPKVGQWYENLDEDTMFRVISMDEDEGIIKLHYDGDDEAEEIDLDTWYELDLEETDAPEGLAGSAVGDDADADEEAEEKDEDDDDEDDWDDDDDEDDEDDDWDDDEDDGSGSSRDDY